MADRTRSPGSSSAGIQTQSSRSSGTSGGPSAPLARPGLISHTEFASRDPAATRAFCERLFGWRFETQEGPTGPYHLFRFGSLAATPAGSTGGGHASRLPIPVEFRQDLAAGSSAGGSVPSGSSPPSGGGIRALGKAEAPLAIPYVEVADLRQAEGEATKAGAKVITPRVSMGNGSVLVLQIPGGPHVGLWAPNP